MSEKEVRELAKEMAGDFAPPGVRDLCKSLLEAEPDVVVLLRKLSELQAEYETILDNGLKGKYPLEEAVERSFQKGVLDTVIGVKSLIQTVFHVRLTDDGWEWVE